MPRMNLTALFLYNSKSPRHNPLRADRILKFRSQDQFVFGKNGLVKTVEWHRPFAGIEAIQARVFVRRMRYLPRDDILRPTADVGEA